MFCEASKIQLMVYLGHYLRFFINFELQNDLKMNLRQHQSHFILFFLLASSSVFAQTLAPPLRQYQNKAFTTGENFKFRLSYGIIPAGLGECNISSKTTTINNRPCYQITATGRTMPSYEWFFYVKDTYETFVDVDAILPHLFLRDVHEDTYKTKQRVDFDQANNFAKSNTATVSTPRFIHDIVSIFFFTRCIDYTDFKPGNYFTVPFFIDDTIFTMNVRYAGKKNVKTDLGTFRCHEFKPQLQKGRLFKEDYGMSVFVTDDENKIPILVRANLIIGSLKMVTTAYSGLKNPPTAKIK